MTRIVSGRDLQDILFESCKSCLKERITVEADTKAALPWLHSLRKSLLFRGGDTGSTPVRDASNRMKEVSEILLESANPSQAIQAQPDSDPVGHYWYR